MAGDKSQKKGGKKNRKFGREARRGHKRTARNIVRSCGIAFARAWGQATGHQGIVETAINKRAEWLSRHSG